MKNTLNCSHDWDLENAQCAFGCECYVPDWGMCPSCNDHSVNMVECKLCGVYGEEIPNTGAVMYVVPKE